MNAALLWLLIGPLAPAALPPDAIAPVEIDPDESVVAGREALDHWWGGYPWYDSQTDGVRRVEVREPTDWSWLWDWMPDWDFGVPFYWLAWGLLILVVVVAVVLLIRASLGDQRLGSGDDADAFDGDGQRIEALPFPVRRDRLDLLGEARRHYGRGDYAQAIIYLFSFQLVQLDRRQIIRLAKGKTNRQYLREVGPRRILRGLLEHTMVAFEDVFFGNRSLDRARFESCWQTIDEFQSLSAETTG